LLNISPSQIRKKLGSHSVIVALPLAIITIFCFSYVLMQTPKALKNNETTAASKRPSLFTGKALPQIKTSAFNQDISQQKLPTVEGDSPTSPSRAAQGPAPSTSNPQTPLTANPQPASKANSSGTGSYSNHNKANDLPNLNVVRPLSQLVPHL
jgi:hypothetical protein